MSREQRLGKTRYRRNDQSSTGTGGRRFPVEATGFGPNTPVTDRDSTSRLGKQISLTRRPFAGENYWYRRRLAVDTTISPANSDGVVLPVALQDGGYRGGRSG